jgi:hypothetical protein
MLKLSDLKWLPQQLGRDKPLWEHATDGRLALWRPVERWESCPTAPGHYYVGLISNGEEKYEIVSTNACELVAQCLVYHYAKEPDDALNS